MMLEMISGCVVPKNDLLSEQYDIQQQQDLFRFTANVHAHKIKEVFQHFITMQTEPLFFILELPTNGADEHCLRKSDTDPMHVDVYYIDGLDADQALTLLTRYGELLINDGISRFGFGVHDDSAELMLGKYNSLTLWTDRIERYQDFFAAHQIPRVEKCFCAWDTFTSGSPGKSMTITVAGKTVYDLPDDLKDQGIYFAERREE